MEKNFPEFPPISILSAIGDLPPILVSLVCVDGFARKLLDRPIPKEDRNKVILLRMTTTLCGIGVVSQVKQMIDTILHTDSSELRPGELLEIMAPTDHKGKWPPPPPARLALQVRLRLRG